MRAVSLLLVVYLAGELIRKDAHVRVAAQLFNGLVVGAVIFAGTCQF